MNFNTYTNTFSNTLINVSTILKKIQALSDALKNKANSLMIGHCWYFLFPFFPVKLQIPFQLFCNYIFSLSLFLSSFSFSFFSFFSFSFFFFFSFLGSGPEGVNDLCFHTYGGFSPPQIPVSSNPSLEAQIPVSRPKSQRRRRRRRKFPCVKA